MSYDLEAAVEQSIDAAIRFHVPGDLASYRQWDAALEKTEELLASAEPFSSRDDLRADVRAMRTRMAYDVEDLDLVLLQTSQFLQEVPASHSSFFIMVLLRMRTLHRTGAHEEEIRTCLDAAKRPEIRGSEYVHLLEHLGRLHPGTIPEDGVLTAKMKESIETLSAQGYSMPEALEADKLEQIAIQIADELRRVNRAMGEAMLAGEV